MANNEYRINFKHENINTLEVVHIKIKQRRIILALHSNEEPCYQCAAVQLENCPSGCVSIGVHCRHFTLCSNGARGSCFPFGILSARSMWIFCFISSAAVFLCFVDRVTGYGLHTIATYERFQCVNRQENWFIIFAVCGWNECNKYMKWYVSHMLI